MTPSPRCLWTPTVIATRTKLWAERWRRDESVHLLSHLSHLERSLSAAFLSLKWLVWCLYLIRHSFFCSLYDIPNVVFIHVRLFLVVRPDHIASNRSEACSGSSPSLRLPWQRVSILVLSVKQGVHARLCVLLMCEMQKESGDVRAGLTLFTAFSVCDSLHWDMLTGGSAFAVRLRSSACWM